MEFHKSLQTKKYVDLNDVQTVRQALKNDQLNANVKSAHKF